jgi:hypothetical protein
LNSYSENPQAQQAASSPEAEDMTAVEVARCISDLGNTYQMTVAPDKITGPIFIFYEFDTLGILEPNAFF